MPAWERPQRKSQVCQLRVDHVMASAALPFFFPAVEVTDEPAAAARVDAVASRRVRLSDPSDVAMAMEVAIVSCPILRFPEAPQVEVILTSRPAASPWALG